MLDWGTNDSEVLLKPKALFGDLPVVNSTQRGRLHRSRDARLWFLADPPPGVERGTPPTVARKALYLFAGLSFGRSRNFFRPNLGKNIRFEGVPIVRSTNGASCDICSKAVRLWCLTENIGRLTGVLWDFYAIMNSSCIVVHLCASCHDSSFMDATSSQFSVGRGRSFQIAKPKVMVSARWVTAL